MLSVFSRFSLILWDTSDFFTTKCSYKNQDLTVIKLEVSNTPAYLYFFMRDNDVHSSRSSSFLDEILYIVSLLFWSFSYCGYDERLVAQLGKYVPLGLFMVVQWRWSHWGGWEKVRRKSKGMSISHLACIICFSAFLGHSFAIETTKSSILA